MDSYGILLTLYPDFFFELIPVFSVNWHSQVITNITIVHSGKVQYLYIYNTIKRKKERFEPLNPGSVKVYVCGPTVYDSCHIGHARSVVVFDVIVR